jgi:hypothetical protein
MRCPVCGGYESDSSGKCEFCGSSARPRPLFSLGGVDVRRLAEGLRDKELQAAKDMVPRLSSCPSCHNQSLFFNGVGKYNQFECLNNRCPLFDKPVTEGSELHRHITTGL